MMRSPCQHSLLVAALACGLSVWASTAVLACPYSIRDSSFISGDGPTTFRLCFLTTSDAPDRDQLDDAVEIATTTWFATSNVVVEIVDVNRSVKHQLRGAIPGRLLDPAATPSVVLISPRNEAIEIPLPDGALGGGALRDSVMDVALRVIDSPMRAQLAEHWPTAWCALIVVTGDDAVQNEAALAAASDAAARIHGTLTEMDKLVEYAPEVIVIPYDSTEERLLLWSLGLNSDTSDRGIGDSETTDGDAPGEDAATAPRVAMLVGRGELRGPVLSGAEITAEKIYKSLEMLGRSCSCTTDAAWLSGPVLPIEWTDEMQAAVVAQLDFDPNDPTAAGAIRDVMSGLDQVLGYQEFTSGYRELTTPDAEEPATRSPIIVVNTDKGASAPPDDGEAPSPEELVAEETTVNRTGAMAAVTDSEAVVVPPVVVWDSTVVLMSLGVVVLILGGGTALVWGRR